MQSAHIAHELAAPDSAAAIFQQEWRIYRKMVDQNYLFHREAYSGLRRVLLEEAPRPFRFLDLACGDASAAADAHLPLLPALFDPHRWLLWLGLAFVLAVYFAPLGIVGALKPAEGKGRPAG